AGNAELFFNRGQGRTVVGSKLSCALGHPGNVRLLDVVRRRLDELRLSRRRRALTAGNIEIGKREIGFHSLRCCFEGSARDPQRLRLRPQALQPSLEQRVGCRARRIRAHPCEEDAETKMEHRISAQWTHVWLL